MTAKPEMETPHPLDMQVTPHPGADDDLVAFGYLYWTTSGSSAAATPVWRHTLTELYTLHGVNLRTAHIVAAAGVRAILTGATCSACGQPLVLCSREDLLRHLEGNPRRCTACTPQVASGITRQHTPEMVQRRTQQRDQRERERALREAEAAWNQAEQAHIAKGHARPAPLCTSVENATLRAEITALTMVRHRPQDLGIASVNSWGRPLAPTDLTSELLLLECALNGLLTLDPESPPQACRWRQTFRQAMIAADHDTTRVGTPHCDGPSLAWASWQVPADGPGAGNKQILDDHLTARLTPKDLPPIRRAALVDLTTELLTTEILRAFVSGLHLANLPSLAHRHHARLQAAAESLANECTLRDGLIYAAAAIAKAGEAADANPAAPQARMSVYALNSFCAGARERWQLPKDRARSDRLERDQLSAMTWTLFKGVLGFNPLSISRSLVETLVTTDLPNPQSQERDLWLNSILDREHLTDPEAVLDTLTFQHQNADPMIAATAEMLTSLVDRLFQVTGDLRSALAAAAAVNEKLDGRIIVPGTASSVRVGDYLSELMWRATGIGPRQT